MKEKIKKKEAKDDFEEELKNVGKSESEKKAEENIEKIKKKILGDK